MCVCVCACACVHVCVCMCVCVCLCSGSKAVSLYKLVQSRLAAASCLHSANRDSAYLHTSVHLGPYMQTSLSTTVELIPPVPLPSLPTCSRYNHFSFLLVCFPLQAFGSLCHGRRGSGIC